MAHQSEAPVVIKKYANRRLYNTGTSTYVTLEDLAQMVKSGVDFLVVDAKSGEDITRNVLTQIIFDAESKGPNLLPITFLRQLIRFYGDSMQRLVPSYLEHSLATLTREQEKFRIYLNSSIGAAALEAMEEQARRNMEVFQRSMRMFMPFGTGESGRAGERASESETETTDPPAQAARRQAPPSAEELDEMRAQLRLMQSRIDHLVAERAADGEPRPDETSASDASESEDHGEDAPAPAKRSAAGD